MPSTLRANHPSSNLPALSAGTPAIETICGHVVQWLDRGKDLLAAQLDAINTAKLSVRFEQYIYRASEVGDRFRDALVTAARRGVHVTVMIDHAGSITLPSDYFDTLEASGGQLIWFNPVRWRFWSFRNHRKLLVVDDAVAYIGGCNIAPEYDGDGIEEGWRDGGLSIAGHAAHLLAQAFDRQTRMADKPIWKVRRQTYSGRIPAGSHVTLLLTRPGFHQNSFDHALRQDLHQAQDVAITCGYFLPTGRTRRALIKAAQRANRFRLLLAGQCDVPLFQTASRALYRKFQRKGAEIYEYQPQVLHAKILVVDDVVYIGSSNLDPRSLSINFELMLRIESPELAKQARETFERDLAYSDLMKKVSWHRPATWWMRFKQKAAYWLFARLDTALAQRMLRS